MGLTEVKTDVCLTAHALQESASQLVAGMGADCLGTCFSFLSFPFLFLSFLSFLISSFSCVPLCVMYIYIFLSLFFFIINCFLFALIVCLSVYLYPQLLMRNSMMQRERDICFP